MTQKGEIDTLECNACGEIHTLVCEGVQETGSYLPHDFILATCDGCGSTTVVGHLPHDSDSRN